MQPRLIYCVSESWKCFSSTTGPIIFDTQLERGEMVHGSGDPAAARTAGASVGVTGPVQATKPTAVSNGEMSASEAANDAADRVAYGEMTSKDYYFDSYAHFGIHEVSSFLLA